MEDMWRSRAPPTPLEFAAIKKGTFVLEKKHAGSNGTHVPQPNGKVQTNGTEPVLSGSAAVEKLLNGDAPAASSSKAGLKDQRALTLKETLELFVSRYVGMQD